MSLQFGKTPIATALDSLLANINSAGNGYVEIRSGAKPANLAAAMTGTLLARCDLVSYISPAFQNTNTTTLISTGNTSGGFFARDTSANAGGTAGYFRLFNDSGTPFFQGTVTGTGGGGDLELDNVVIALGAVVTIVSWTIQATGMD